MEKFGDSLRDVELELTSCDFEKKEYKTVKFPHNSHYLYILENGREAYVGETNDIVHRGDAHHTPKDRCYPYHFKRMYVITGLSFDGTPAKHYETVLIRLMKIDKKFKIITDDNEGTIYNRKTKFELAFDKLWTLLGEKKLVREKKFKAIWDSDAYRYSQFACLTQNQLWTLTSIVNALDVSDLEKQRDPSRHRPILIEGDAGTGKTILAATLYYNLKMDERYKNLRVALVYAQPTPRKAMKRLFAGIQRGLGKDIVAPAELSKARYDIAICDEAHHLKRNRNLPPYQQKNFLNANIRLGLGSDCDELDWVMNGSEKQVLFYDKKQLTSPTTIPEEDFRRRLCMHEATDDVGVRPIALQGQMRIKAGDRYVKYIFDILWQRNPAPMEFPNYEFILFDSFRDMLESIWQMEEKMGLCRLCSGYGWKWTSGNEIQKTDMEIEGIKLRWNRQAAGWLQKEDAKREMGSIYSLFGLDLHYAGVVMGPDLYWDERAKEIKVDKKNFFDNKVKKSSSEAELREFVLRAYGLLLTRGIHGTFLYVCDEGLRSNMARYIPKYGGTYRKGSLSK